MNVTEWEKVCSEVAALFDRSSKWTPDSTKRVYQQFGLGTKFRSAMDVLQDMFLSGRAFAPSPSEVITAARTRGGVEAAPRLSKCPHATYSVFTFHGDGTGATGMCVVCRTEYVWGEGAGPLTVGDLEEAAKKRAETANVF